MLSVSEKLRVCMLSAEVQPYAKVGGLADVVTALSDALEAEGVEVKIITPLYRQVRSCSELRKISELPAIEMGNRHYSSALYVDAKQESGRSCFVENEEFFDRQGIYTKPATGEGYEDDFQRFNFFQLAALEGLRQMDWKPEIVHCHDYQTALIPAYLKLGRIGNAFFKEVSTLLTIHNLAFQGIFDAETFALTGLAQELFYATGPFEYHGNLNCMKAGICYADVLTTVSPRYAREIQTEESGCGLESVLQGRQKDLYGVLNGVDNHEWNPKTDPLIFANFSAENLEGKSENKRRLQDFLGLAVEDVPLIGMISRLTDQKGFDLILEVKDELGRMDCQWVILGTGLKRYHQALTEMEQRNPGKFSVQLRYDNELAHRIEAGCDLFLMPSRYEPCGLNQLYSLRYGTIPVVRHTGGLADTVEEFDPEAQTGTGFKFYDYHSRELLKVLHQAVHIWEQKKVWKQLIFNAMARDFSWSKSSRSYLELYRQLISQP